MSLLVALIRICYSVFFEYYYMWGALLMIIGYASLILGCFGGLTQKKIGQIIAYSAIGNIGLILLAMADGSVIGVEIEDASGFIDLSRLELKALPIANLILSERVPARA